jgi:hypothetical protein
MAIDWDNKGSCKDLSNLLPGDPISALAPTSQEGGNQQSSSADAMTAPGSPPVDNLRDDQNLVDVDPKVSPSNKVVIEPSDDGKPPATEMVGYSPSRPAWAPTTTPHVVRKA